MFLQTNSIRKPKRNFNLLHLEGPECHLTMLKANLMIDNLNEEYYTMK